MVFASNRLRDAFEGQGEAGFIAWTYATFDTLEQVLTPGYFNAFRRFSPGDLVYVGTQPRPANSPWTTQQQGKETRRALLMIRGRDDKGQLHVRLVQDYGRPDDPDGPRVVAKKSRGRPRAAQRGPDTSSGFGRSVLMDLHVHCAPIASPSSSARRLKPL